MENNRIANCFFKPYFGPRESNLLSNFYVIVFFFTNYGHFA